MKTTKKVLALILALALMTGLAPVTFAAMTPSQIEAADEATLKAASLEVFINQYGFVEAPNTDPSDPAYAYKSLPTLVSKKAFDDNGAEVKGAADDYWLDLYNEKIMPKTKGSGDTLEVDVAIPAKFISFTGGEKWAPVSIPATGLDISKELKKGGTIVLTTNLDTSVKPNVPKEGKAASGTPDTDNYVAAVNGSNTYTFKTIAARPKAEKFKPNYLKFADMTGESNGDWTAPDGIDVTKLNISVADSTGKAPAYGWFNFPDGKADTQKHGIHIQDMNAGKPGKTTYLVRTAPNMATMTPASAPMKLSVPSVQKAPNFKIDYKKETIKVKAGTIWDIGYVDTDYYNSIGELDNTNGSEIVDGVLAAKDGYTAVSRNMIEAGALEDASGKSVNKDSKGNLTPMDKDAAKAGIALTVDKKYSLYGETVGVRLAATEKKPASAVQLITVAEQAKLYQVDFKPTFAKGKMTVDKKKYEFYDEAKGKWGGIPKAAGTYKVRIKNTAKYDVKTNTTKGDVNSAYMEVTLAAGSYDEKKPDKQGLVGYTVKSFPQYDGLVWVDSTKWFAPNTTAAGAGAITGTELKSLNLEQFDKLFATSSANTGLYIGYAQFTLKGTTDDGDPIAASDFITPSGTAGASVMAMISATLPDEVVTLFEVENAAITITGTNGTVTVTVPVKLISTNATNKAFVPEDLDLAAALKFDPVVETGTTPGTPVWQTASVATAGNATVNTNNFLLAEKTNAPAAVLPLTAADSIKVAYTAPGTGAKAALSGVITTAPAAETKYYLDGKKNLVITITADDNRKLQVGANDPTEANVAALLTVPAGSSISPEVKLVPATGNVTQITITVTAEDLSGINTKLLTINLATVTGAVLDADLESILTAIAAMNDTQFSASSSKVKDATAIGLSVDMAAKKGTGIIAMTSADVANDSEIDFALTTALSGKSVTAAIKSVSPAPDAVGTSALGLTIDNKTVKIETGTGSGAQTPMMVVVEFTKGEAKVEMTFTIKTLADVDAYVKELLGGKTFTVAATTATGANEIHYGSNTVYYGAKATKLTITSAKAIDILSKLDAGDSVTFDAEGVITAVTVLASTKILTHYAGEYTLADTAPNATGGAKYASNVLTLALTGKNDVEPLAITLPANDPAIRVLSQLAAGDKFTIGADGTITGAEATVEATSANLLALMAGDWTYTSGGGSADIADITESGKTIAFGVAATAFTIKLQAANPILAQLQEGDSFTIGADGKVTAIELRKEDKEYDYQSADLTNVAVTLDTSALATGKHISIKVATTTFPDTGTGNGTIALAVNAGITGLPNDNSDGQLLGQSDKDTTSADPKLELEPTTSFTASNVKFLSITEIQFPLATAGTIKVTYTDED